MNCLKKGTYLQFIAKNVIYIIWAKHTLLQEFPSCTYPRKWDWKLTNQHIMVYRIQTEDLFDSLICLRPFD